MKPEHQHAEQNSTMLKDQQPVQWRGWGKSKTSLLHPLRTSTGRLYKFISLVPKFSLFFSSRFRLTHFCEEQLLRHFCEEKLLTHFCEEKILQMSMSMSMASWRICFSVICACSSCCCSICCYCSCGCFLSLCVLLPGWGSLEASNSFNFGFQLCGGVPGEDFDV